MKLFAVAAMEEAAETNGLEQIIEDMTSSEAAAAGFVFGLAVGMFIVVALIWFILQVIADWKIFTKAGIPGWKSLIPFYNIYLEYSICWEGYLGLIYALLISVSYGLNPAQDSPTWQLVLVAVAGIAALVLTVRQSILLAKAFGKGTGFGIFLILFGPIGRIILGCGKAQYAGKPKG